MADVQSKEIVVIYDEQNVGTLCEVESALSTRVVRTIAPIDAARQPWEVRFVMESAFSLARRELFEQWRISIGLPLDFRSRWAELIRQVNDVQIMIEKKLWEER